MKKEENSDLTKLLFVLFFFLQVSKLFKLQFGIHYILLFIQKQRDRNRKTEICLFETNIIVWEELFLVSIRFDFTTDLYVLRFDGKRGIQGWLVFASGFQQYLRILFRSVELVSSIASCFPFPYLCQLESNICIVSVEIWLT